MEKVRDQKVWKQVRDPGKKLKNGNKLKMELKVYYVYVK